MTTDPTDPILCPGTWPGMAEHPTTGVHICTRNAGHRGDCECDCGATAESEQMEPTADLTTAPQPATPGEAFDLDEIEARADAATPGPWQVIDPNEGSGVPPAWEVVNDAYLNPGSDQPWISAELHVGAQSDAEFIAHARADIPRLVAEVRRLRQYAETTRYHQRRHAQAVREAARLRAEVSSSLWEQDQAQRRAERDILRVAAHRLTNARVAAEWPQAVEACTQLLRRWADELDAAPATPGSVREAARWLLDAVTAFVLAPAPDDTDEDHDARYRAMCSAAEDLRVALDAAPAADPGPDTACSNPNCCPTPPAGTEGE